MIPPKKELIICPDGSWQAVCYDIWNIGLQESEFKGKLIVLPKIIITWELSETIPKGQRVGEHFTINRRYTFSYNRKAWLRIDLESWLGRPLTEREHTDFDVETMIGKNCFLSVIHKVVDERTFANVQTVMSLPKGTPLIQPTLKRSVPDWVKELQDKAIPASEPDEAEAVAEEETPF